MQNHNAKPKADLKSRSYYFALNLIKLIDFLPKKMTCQVIGKQLIRSATSIGANIIEAKAASSKRDFTNFFTHSLKSANETLFWLNLLKDSQKLSHPDLLVLIAEAHEIAKMLGSSVLTLKGKRN